MRDDTELHAYVVPVFIVTLARSKSDARETARRWAEDTEIPDEFEVFLVGNEEDIEQA